MVQVKTHQPLRWVVAATILGQFLLHLVYGGEETFLYALHWVPVLIVLIAFAATTKLRRIVVGLAGLLVVLSGVNNQRQFDSMVQWLSTPHACWTAP